MTDYISRNPTLMKTYGAGFMLTSVPAFIQEIAVKLEADPQPLSWLSVIGYLLVACCFGYGIRTVTIMLSKVTLCLAMVFSLLCMYGVLRPLVTGWVMVPAFVAMICIGVGLGVSGFRRSRSHYRT